MADAPEDTRPHKQHRTLRRMGALFGAALALAGVHKAESEPVQPTPIVAGTHDDGGKTGAPGALTGRLADAHRVSRDFHFADVPEAEMAKIEDATFMVESLEAEATAVKVVDAEGKVHLITNTHVADKPYSGGSYVVMKRDGTVVGIALPCANNRKAARDLAAAHDYETDYSLSHDLGELCPVERVMTDAYKNAKPLKLAAGAPDHTLRVVNFGYPMGIVQASEGTVTLVHTKEGPQLKAGDGLSITHGDSGGPIVDIATGEVVGLNAAAKNCKDNKAHPQAWCHVVSGIEVESGAQKDILISTDAWGVPIQEFSTVTAFTDHELEVGYANYIDKEMQGLDEQKGMPGMAEYFQDIAKARKAEMHYLHTKYKDDPVGLVQEFTSSQGGVPSLLYRSEYTNERLDFYSKKYGVDLLDVNVEQAKEAAHHHSHTDHGHGRA